MSCASPSDSESESRAPAYSSARKRGQMPIAKCNRAECKQKVQTVSW
jgi:hypothetical protein